MSSPARDDAGSYEAVLAREDRRNRRGLLVLTALFAAPMALYYDARAVLGIVLLLLLVMVGFDLWHGLGMIRTGYATRGRAVLRGLWEYPVLAVLLVLLWLVQSRFGLWFDQHPFRRYR